LSDEEVHRFQGELTAILNYFDVLKELDTDEIQPMDHVLEVKGIWQEDRLKQSRESKLILSNAPSLEKKYIRVPKILES
jgi:aspartyl/glutamyl-tRNA(Asn/Gln) amidotransferase C subunit